MKKSFLKSLIILLVLRQNGLSTLTAALRHWVHAILPLSSCPRGTRMIFKGIMCCALVVACASCKSVEVVSSSEVQDVQKFRSVDTVVVRDSVLVRDSVVQRERTIHDTVYITKEVYRDRLEARGERQKAVRTDTVVVTEWRDRVIEHPPERYVPPFYKRCTLLFWLILVASALYMVGKIYLKRRL